MHVSYVTAEQLGAVPLWTTGDKAKIRFKFVLIDDELVYGNIRDHLTLAQWLLCGPLRSRFPLNLAAARPLIETQGVLTVFGNITHDDDFEFMVYVTPSAKLAADIETEIIAALGYEFTF